MSAPPFDLSALRRGENRLPCPECDHGPRDSALAVRLADDGRVVWKCHRCGWAGAWREPRSENQTHPPQPTKPSLAAFLGEAATFPVSGGAALVSTSCSRNKYVVCICCPQNAYGRFVDATLVSRPLNNTIVFFNKN